MEYLPLKLIFWQTNLKDYGQDLKRYFEFYHSMLLNYPTFSAVENTECTVICNIRYTVQ